MTNSRIKEIAPGLNSEAIATDIHFRYDPAKKEAQADFHFQDFIVKADDNTTLPYGSNRYDTIVARLDSVLTRNIGKGLIDPVTLQPMNFTAAGLLVAMKQLANDLHNERAALMVPTGNP